VLWGIAGLAESAQLASRAPIVVALSPRSAAREPLEFGLERRGLHDVECACSRTTPRRPGLHGHSTSVPDDIDAEADVLVKEAADGLVAASQNVDPPVSRTPRCAW